MNEPPKPITQLAAPIDRTGARGRNRLGVVAMRLAVWTWPVGFFLMALVEQLFAARWPDEQRVAERISSTLFVLLTPLALGTAIILAIAALPQARNRHLQRRDAVFAMVVSAAGGVLWYVWYGRSLLARLF